MNSDNIFALFDAIMFGAGVYCLYSWYLMHFKRVIHENRLTIPPDNSISSCRDKDGYMAFMGPRLLVFSLVCIVVGGVNLLSHAYPIPGAVQFACIVILFLNIMWFAFAIRKTAQEFWPPKLS